MLQYYFKGLVLTLLIEVPLVIILRFLALRFVSRVRGSETDINRTKVITVYNKKINLLLLFSVFLVFMNVFSYSVGYAMFNWFHISWWLVEMLVLIFEALFYGLWFHFNVETVVLLRKHSWWLEVVLGLGVSMVVNGVTMVLALVGTDI